MEHLEDPGTWVVSDDGDPFRVDTAWSNSESLGSHHWVVDESARVFVDGGMDLSPDEARRLARLLVEAADEGERRWASAASAREHPDWFTPFAS